MKKDGLISCLKNIDLIKALHKTIALLCLQIAPLSLRQLYNESLSRERGSGEKRQTRTPENLGVVQQPARKS